MNKTKIEWVRNPDGSQGYSWNVITGCLNHVNGLCKGGGFPCYAYKLAHGWLRSGYLANEVITPYTGRWNANDDPFFPRWWYDRLNIKRKYEYGDCRNHIERRGIFVCDMSDLFGYRIPYEWQNQVFRMIRENPDDRFYLLTKQPQNLIRFSPFPDNCWVGVTATNEDMFQQLLFTYGIEAKVKYISFEPLLQPIHLRSCDLTGINWVIIGAQTKPYKPPEISWVEEIVQAADKAGVKVFLKNNLKPLLTTVSDDDFTLFVNDMWELRQELPQ